jgi:hypothetical protein
MRSKLGATPGIEPGFLTLYPDRVVDLGQRRFARRLVVSVLSVGRRRYLTYCFTSFSLGLPAAFAWACSFFLRISSSSSSASGSIALTSPCRL